MGGQRGYKRAGSSTCMGPNLFMQFVRGVKLSFFFFFQAEDGIRDLTVTGVQTCALPICNHLYISLLPAVRNQRPRSAALGDRSGRDGSHRVELPLVVPKPCPQLCNAVGDRKSVV